MSTTVAVADVALPPEPRVEVVQPHLEGGAHVARPRGHVQSSLTFFREVPNFRYVSYIPAPLFLYENHLMRPGPYNPKWGFFFGRKFLLVDRVRLDKSFPMGPCSTSGDKNSLRYDLGPHHCGCHVSTE